MSNKELLNRIHDFLGKVVRDCPDQDMSLEASDLADDVWDALHQSLVKNEIENRKEGAK